MSETREYYVRWEISLDADSPLEAALAARQILRDPDSHANYYEVCHGSHWDDDTRTEHWLPEGDDPGVTVDG